MLAGKYRIERVLGRGGMGVVVQAHHTVLGERVAIKFLLTEQVASNDAMVRFLREAKAAARIKSQHIARVSDVGTLDDGAPYMVMEYLEGRDLSQVLEVERVIRTEDAVDFIIQACDAIAEAHSAGIIHRDIKPANLFLTRHHDGSPLIKVLDFGISKFNSAEEPDGITRTAAIMGSALYMSPEQLQRTKAVDLRTDIYALGITLYELLSCRQPFEAETLPELAVAIVMGEPTPLGQLRPDLDPGLIAVIEKAFARDLGQRYQNVGDFVLALQPYAPARCAALVERIARTAGGAVSSDQLFRNSYGSLPGTAQVPMGGSTDLSSVQTTQSGSGGARWPYVVAALGLLALGGAAAGVFIIQKSSAQPADAPSAALANSSLTETVPSDEAPAKTAEAAPSAEAPPEAPSAEPEASATATADEPAKPKPSRVVVVRSPSKPAKPAPTGNAADTKPTKPAEPPPKPAEKKPYDPTQYR
ncbi:MAG: serine/threonine protein kinase [Myxococcales bacterium]|nr:serine/threonine protein kinase [Myxococcales bacterium]